LQEIHFKFKRKTCQWVRDLSWYNRYPSNLYSPLKRLTTLLSLLQCLTMV